MTADTLDATTTRLRKQAQALLKSDAAADRMEALRCIECAESLQRAQTQAECNRTAAQLDAVEQLHATARRWGSDPGDGAEYEDSLRDMRARLAAFAAAGVYPQRARARGGLES